MGYCLVISYFGLSLEPQTNSIVTNIKHFTSFYNFEAVKGDRLDYFLVVTELCRSANLIAVRVWASLMSLFTINLSSTLHHNPFGTCYICGG